MQVCDITNFSRGSFHDGPGIRTVVYFNNCSLRCKWCHNPETISKDNEILYIKSKCIHCGKCIEICPEHHKAVGDSMEFFREGCTKCGKCGDACPSGALNISGESYTPERLMKEIRKDKHYFEESGGGVTFSGGECLLKPQFLREVLKMCKAENIHTCIESAFHVPFENIGRVYELVDLVFADLKIPLSQKHREYTGAGNELIIENIRKLSQIHRNITVRIPLIPKVNDSVEDMKDFADIINTFRGGVKAVELLKYNYLAESKYEILGKEYTKFSDSTQSDAYVQSLVSALKSHLTRDLQVFSK